MKFQMKQRFLLKENGCFTVSGDALILEVYMMKKFKKTASAVTAFVMLSSAVYSDNVADAAGTIFENNIHERRYTLSEPLFSVSPDGETDFKEPVYSGRYPVSTMYASVFPESFDMREKYGVTPVKNQSGYGTCWAHSSIACAESSILRSDPSVDLSEFHTAYFTYSGGDQIPPESDDIKEILSSGGTSGNVVNLWSQWIGPVSESRMPYGDLSFYEDAEKIEQLKNTADYHLRSAHTFDYDKERSNEKEINALIKEYVLDGKAVDVSFYSNSKDCYDSVKHSTNSHKKPRFANHSVAVIGWDDNYPADGFLQPAKENGAWLVKNSWGANYGENGYIWISYEDRSLTEFTVYELDSKNNFTKNFQHDSFVPVQTLSVFDDTETNAPSYMANVFTADETTVLGAVGTYIRQPGTEYEITIYTGLRDRSDPTSGTAVTAGKGIGNITGYTTIDLDKKVTVGKSEDFSVVVKLFCKDSPFVVPLETCMIVTDDTTGEIESLGSYTTYEGITQYTGKNESFFSQDGENWLDVTENDEVYSDEEEQELLEVLEVDLYDGIEPDETELLENAGKSLENFKEMFAKGTVALKMGNISLKVFGDAPDTVKFSQIEGAVPFGEKIELSSDSGEIYCRIGENGDFKPYTQPIEITEKTVIYASSEKNGENPQSSRYYPEKASLYSLEYALSSLAEAGKTHKYAYSASESNIVIEADTESEKVFLIPQAAGKIYHEDCEYSSGSRIPLNIAKGRNSERLRITGKDVPDGILDVTILRCDSGDANGDGFVNASDASLILADYSALSVGGEGIVLPEMRKYADFDGDGSVTAKDASGVLMRYSELSTS